MITLFQTEYEHSEIDLVVKQVWEIVNKYNIIAFSGEMGAGKTTFISTLCNFLQVKDAVSSPTFALINEYHFIDKNGRDNIIFHIDLYRLKNEQEAIDAGIEDCLADMPDNCYCFVEWPEKAPGLFPAPYAKISLGTVSHTKRSITISVVE